MPFQDNRQLDFGTDSFESVASRMSAHARRHPEMPAIIEANGGTKDHPEYSTTTYEKLDSQSEAIARALIHWGVQPGMRLVLLVPFGAQFITLVLALLKARIVAVLVDPGMGRNRMLECLQELSPDGFITISKVQGMRWLMRKGSSKRNGT